MRRGHSGQMAEPIYEGYVLEVEGHVRIEDPSLSDVERVVSLIHPGQPSFFILNAPDGSYVQTAGARLRLIVEYRQVSGGVFRHYVLGRREEERREASINYSGGAITLRKNEVLVLRDALSVFGAFLRSGRVPEGYEWRDVTERFQAAA